MTAYGDLDASILDELPPGRKPIQTVHRTDAARLGVSNFWKTKSRRAVDLPRVSPH